MTFLVDAHVHIFQSKEVGQWWKDAYDVWEYGEKSGVIESALPGDLIDLQSSIDAAGYSHAIFLQMFSPQVERERDGALETEMWTRFQRLNEWGCSLVEGDSRISALAAVDPSVGSPGQLADAVCDLAARYSIKGIKLHPVLQRFQPNDERLYGVYEACQDLGLVVLSHGGASHGTTELAAPSAFAPLLRRFPKLKLQLAHLGGGRWRETASFAEEFSTVRFDLSEIIEWTGAPHAPTVIELSALIRSIGPERVLMGSDFPWYDLERTAALVDGLPGLSRSDKDAIMGLNAAELFGLTC
ncbi:MAG TPA: amidohydrolase family protein [Thermoleophilaceae bacterium]|nr:amidohydrolase family protein [Thermoleophilaceae bacterium]